jgi:hypothetical protein
MSNATSRATYTIITARVSAFPERQRVLFHHAIRYNLIVRFRTIETIMHKPK